MVRSEDLGLHSNPHHLYRITRHLIGDGKGVPNPANHVPLLLMT